MRVLLLAFLVTLSSDKKSDTPENVLLLMKAAYQTKCVSQEMSYTLSNPSLGEDVVKTGSSKVEGVKSYVNLGSEILCTDGVTTYLVLKNEEEISIQCHDAESSPFLNSLDLAWEYTKSLDDAYQYKAHFGDGNAVTIWVDVETHLIKKAIIKSPNQTTFTYLFADQKIQNSCPDSDFEIDPQSNEFANYYVNDERDGCE